MKKYSLLTLACLAFILPSCGDDNDKEEDSEKIETICDCVDLMIKNVKGKTKAPISAGRKCAEFFQDPDGIKDMQACDNYDEYQEALKATTELQSK